MQRPTDTLIVVWRHMMQLQQSRVAQFLFLFALRKYLLFLGEPLIYVCNQIYLVRGIKDNGAYIGDKLLDPKPFEK